jgi:hypothetical protein
MIFDIITFKLTISNYIFNVIKWYSHHYFQIKKCLNINKYKLER